MCFSAIASFTSAAILVPTGLFCLRKTNHTSKPYWTLALIPIAFGIQQAFEGGVWWALEGKNAEVLRLSTLGFLFFSHLFWLVWVPFSCYLTETVKSRRTLFLLITGVGAVCGATMFPPFLLYPNWLTVSVANHSIIYQTTLIYDNYLPKIVGVSVYMAILILPLLLSSERYIRILGKLILFSMMASLIFFNLAFISVWCYFAAVISLYICYIIIVKAEPAECPT